MIEMILN